jgi:hypothetical protein
MTPMKICPMVMMALAIGLAGAAYAQEAPTPTQAAAPAGTVQAATPPSSATTSTPTSTPANASQAKAPATTTTATTPAGPSPALLKKARQGGYQVKVRKGNTYFCKTEAQLGTRFAQENCWNQDQFESALEKQQLQREQLNQSICSGGGSCGGGK